MYQILQTIALKNCMQESGLGQDEKVIVFRHHKQINVRVWRVCVGNLLWSINYLPYVCICSITLILVASDYATADSHATYLLEVVFGAMVLLVGLHELENITNIERLKKDLKVNLGYFYCCHSYTYYACVHTQCCYPLIDHILQGGEVGQVSLFTQCTDILAVNDKEIIEVVGCHGITEVGQ